MTFWRYLVFGGDDLYLSPTWLADTDRLALYEAYTKRQWWQGSVTQDVASMRRRAFWEALEGKRDDPPVVLKAAFGKRKIS